MDWSPLGGHSDPYVLTFLDGEKKARTHTIDDTGDPVWNQDLNIKPEGNPQNILFRIYDEDTFKKDDFIGEVSVPLAPIFKGEKLVQAQLPISNPKLKLKGAMLTVSISYISTNLSWVKRDEVVGNRKALLIGINYHNLPQGRGRLKGCVNDVKNMKELISDNYKYEEANIKVIHDELEDESEWPTRANIFKGIDWLVSGAKSGDLLWFHFSGHGTQIDDETGDELDGKDETIVPLDFKQSKFIVDDDLKHHLVDVLPAGVRLTCVMDCCHSGTGMDLPFERVVFETSAADFRSHSMEVYNTQEEKEENKKYHKESSSTKLKAKINGWLESNKRHPDEKPGKKIEIEGLNAAGGQIKQAQELIDGPDVILISGCQDDQTSADAFISGESTGAMSHALIMVIDEHGNDITIEKLVVEMRNHIKAKNYSQVPQLSALRPFDLSCQFHPC